MRILCCLNRDLASNVALNLLLPTFARHTVCVGLTEQVGGTHQLPEELRERHELRIAEQSFPNEILFPLIERACLPDDGTRYLTFTEIERLRQIPVISLPNPNTPDALETIRHFAPDLILTIRYGAILKPPVIAIPKFGVLNLHSGMLPAYRGVLATFRALMNGDTEIGCTLHRISDITIDTGEIIDVTGVPVVSRHSLLWHILSLYPTSVAMIVNAVARLDAGESLAARAQSASGGTYYSYPTAAEWAAFTHRGWLVTQLSELEEVFRRYSTV
jgi:methionyl-tRNA formyltransferase